MAPIRVGAAFVAACALLTAPSVSFAQTKSLQQLQSEHIDLRFGMFIHFNMNTFFPGWANARTDPKTFNPTALDPTQWATAAKSARMTYAVLTTKHHDGFAIWPSKQTPPNGMSPYTIAQSSVPTRDVVKEYVDAFRAQGILPGLYFSMWDVANVGGTYANPGYSDNGSISWSRVKTYILGQLTELLGGTYGDIPLLIIDGWSWSMGHRYVPVQEIRALVKRLQPNCLIVDHNGAMPWEVDIMYFEEPLRIQAPAGNTIAAAQGQTISGDWFWDSTAADINQLKTASDIVSHLTRLQPLYTNFLLNCPPNRQGVLDASIVTRLGEVGQMWTVNTSRAALPAQPPAIEYPITAALATATSASGSAGAAIDSTNDYSGGPRHQTLWTSSGALPQSVTIDLGAVYSGIDILKYVPNRDSATGAITSYRVLASSDGSSFSEIASGSWAGNSSIQAAQFTATTARFVRLEAAAVNGGSAAVVGEIAVGGHAAPVTTGSTGAGGAGTGAGGGGASGGRGGASGGAAGAAAGASGTGAGGRAGATGGGASGGGGASEAGRGGAGGASGVDGSTGGAAAGASGGSTAGDGGGARGGSTGGTAAAGTRGGAGEAGGGPGGATAGGGAPPATPSGGCACEVGTAAAPEAAARMAALAFLALALRRRRGTASPTPAAPPFPSRPPWRGTGRNHAGPP